MSGGGRRGDEGLQRAARSRVEALSKDTPVELGEERNESTLTWSILEGTPVPNSKTR